MGRLRLIVIAGLVPATHRKPKLIAVRNRLYGPTLQTDEDQGNRQPELISAKVSIISFSLLRLGEGAQAVGTVPPSMTYSLPVIEAARGETRKATRSATSLGFAGRPSGMPPSELITILRADS